MRVVIQRVSSAHVTVQGQLVSKIGPGLCVLVGLSRNDTEKDAEYMCRKILNTRLWPNKDGRPWSMSVAQQNYEVLLVSQFTLYCVLKGNKPDFHNAMNPDQAKAGPAVLVQLRRPRTESLPAPPSVRWRVWRDDGSFACERRSGYHNSRQREARQRVEGR